MEPLFHRAMNKTVENDFADSGDGCQTRADGLLFLHTGNFTVALITLSLWSRHAGFALARLGAILSAGGAFYASSEPLGRKRDSGKGRSLGASLLRWASAQSVAIEDGFREKIRAGLHTGTAAVVSILVVSACCLSPETEPQIPDH